jgi:pyruvate dehydrogenase E1 component alpha subunit
LIRSHQIPTSWFDDVAHEADERARELRAEVLSMPDPSPLSMFDFAYAEPHSLVEAGRREMQEFASGEAL